jgi:glycerol transport system ATP-binding protein
VLSLSGLQLGPDRPATPDLEFCPGSINVVLGRNHSGKTALCRLVAGLPSPATALVRIDGEEQGRDIARSRPVAMVYQAFVNYPNWNVADNIASPLKAGTLGRLTASDINRRVRELASKVRIEELLHRMPDELSGGQQQRLAIARALAKEPKVLVMDEPLVNIDYKLREELAEELRFLVRDTQTCLVYATSDPRDALSLADSLVLLQDGEVLQTGEPLDVYRYPHGFAAADLMSDPGINRLGRSGAVRPEHVLLEPGEGLSFAATISGVETNGAETYLHASVVLDSEVCEWVVKLRGMKDLRPGDEATLHVRAMDVLNFEDESRSGADLG